MKLSTAKRRINKTLDELTQSVIDDWYDHFKNGYIKGYTDAREGVAPMYADAIADTPQTDKDKVVCPNCGRSDYIRSFEKDFNIKNSVYRYKCINCNTYIKDAPQTESKLKANKKSVEIPTETENFTSKSREKSKLKQTDCGWK